MNNTPQWIRNIWAKEEKPPLCVRHAEGTCKGRITREHALIYAGRQIQELWAIIPLCAFHHAVDFYQDSGDLRKRVNEVIAVSRATAEELKKYPKANWDQLLRYEYDPTEPTLLRKKS